MAHHTGLRKTMLGKRRHHLRQSVRRTTHQQAAAGLRVAEQGLIDRAKALGQRHLRAITRPVATRGAGDETCVGKVPHTVKHRHRRPIQVHIQGRAAGHFQRMARQTKTCHIGQSMHTLQSRQIGAGGVQTRGRVDHLRITRRRQLFFFQRGGHDAHANRLAQHQDIASTC